MSQYIATTNQDMLWNMFQKIPEVSQHSMTQRQDMFRNSISHFYQQMNPQAGLNRDQLQENLKSRNIPTAVYYPIPLNKHKPYASYPVSRTGLSVTNYLSKNVLSLPMHPYLSEDDIIFITKQIYESIKNS